ncbi:sigma-70 family RNA polymerase sigma factor [Gordonia alkaliphila]|uniref:sigma-70 family RNA polymerase sigma factor n=1 Tax=Gordonia alkaliphila TaxID=1053547 RepID=UPI001FF6AFC3|nr:sigma-70 family RNA polymerase sigma factor [Gordonia alkaliphila]MCK0440114.1 sigma-70 family RNA polymerase sigma factor [Gordonia alkaliphila]
MTTLDDDRYARAAELLRERAACGAGDEHCDRLRARAIVLCLPLAEHIACRYSGRGEPFDDLLQVARVGVIQAVDRFDPAAGADLLSFAVPTVMGEVRRHFRDRVPTIRVPRRLREQGELVTVVSLDAARPDGFGAPDPGYRAVDDRLALAPALRVLASTDRRILRLRFRDEKSQREIAETVGISQVHVSRRLRTTLNALRSELNPALS